MAPRRRPLAVSAAAAAVVTAAAVLSSRAFACTIIAAGKDASYSGHPIVCHTDDSGSDTTDIRFTRVPRKRWPKGSTRKLYNWVDGYPRIVAPELSPEYAPVHGQQLSVPIGEIPQVGQTYAYWDMDYGVQNEAGLSIGESTCTARTVGWPATPDKPYGYNRAGIEDLSKLAMERCATARCAVDVMGKIAVDQGFYSADSGEPEDPGYSDSAEALAVADTEELWIFNVMTGRNNASAIWAAQRIPPGHVAAVGNSFTIRKMNLTDPDNYRFSPGVTDLAEEMGWWKPSVGPFDFFAAYGYEPNVSAAPNRAKGELDRDVVAYYSGRRMWRIFSLLSPSEGAKLDPNKGNLPSTEDPYPGSVPAPRGSVTARKLFEVLRDHYEGTPYDMTAGMAAGPFGTPNRAPRGPPGTLGYWERVISMHRTSWSFVLEARPAGQGIVWLGYDAPHGTAYLPFFGAADSAPESFRSHEGYQSKFSTKVAWWAFNLINQYTDLNFKLINADVRSKSTVIEDAAEKLVAECLAKAANLSGAASRKELTRCSNAFAEKKVGEWWDLAWSLFAKYGRYAITHNESGNGMQLQGYPEWWLTSAEVGYTMWSTKGPFHGVPDPAPAQGPLEGDALAAAAVAAPIASAPVSWLAVVMSVAVGAAGFQLGKCRGLQLGRGRGDAEYVYLAA